MGGYVYDVIYYSLEFWGAEKIELLDCVAVGMENTGGFCSD